MRSLLTSSVCGFGVLSLFSTVAVAESGLFVLTSDFETGSTAFLPAGASTADIDLLTIHSDASARYRNGRVYVLNRLGQDNVLVLDADDWRKPITQFSVGNGMNPHDIAFAGPSKAYISRYGSVSVLIVDPRDGTELGEIDLSGFADADGLPEMSQMAMIGSRLYVACQRLDRDGGFEPVSPSVLAVIDTETDALVDMDSSRDGVQGWELSATNPNSLIAVGGNQLFVSMTGSFGDMTGGIEILDVADGNTRGLVLTETELGGDLNWLELVSNVKGFVVVSDENFMNHIKPVDLASGTVGQALPEHSTGFTQSLSVDGARLIVPDPGTFDNPESAGLLIFDAHTDEFIEGPIPVGLPPLRVVVLDDAPVITAVLEEGLPVPLQSSLEAAYPNPFNADVSIPFAVSNAGKEVRLVVYDSLGQTVRTVLNARLPGGRYRVAWDGRDESGEVLGNGVYVIAMRAGDIRLRQKVILLK